MGPNNPSRRLRAHISQFGTNALHFRNPFIIAAWSALMPGLGSLLQDRKLKGFIILVWAMVVNWGTKLNLAIYYTLTGRFDEAREVVDTRWMLLYVGLYVYAVWDSYRGTVEMNNTYILADREDAPLQPFIINSLDINYLDKRPPWMAVAWSAMTPGLGNLYVHRLISGTFFITWTIVVMYMSHGLEGIHLTMLGAFADAKSILNLEWVLYFPPVYGCLMYHCYVSAVEYNRLFEKEQSRWLKDHYQSPGFNMPL